MKGSETNSHVRRGGVQRNILHAFFLILLFFNFGCNYTRPKNNLQSGEKSFVWVYNAIIIPHSCLLCHNGPSGAMGVDASSYKALVDSGYLVPFKPHVSKFFLTIADGSMPKTGERVSSANVKRLEEWILAGAPESGGEAVPKTPVLPTPPPQPPPPKATYSWIRENIFKVRCQACHQPPKPDADLDLISSHKELMIAEGLISKIVKSGDPERSSLYQEVLSNRMPKNGPPCTPEEKKTIYDWIKKGAPND